MGILALKMSEIVPFEGDFSQFLGDFMRKKGCGIFRTLQQ